MHESYRLKMLQTMLANRSFILKFWTGRVMYSLWLDSDDERRAVVTVHLGALIKEDAWRSQTAGRNIHPLLAQRVRSAVRWVQLFTALLLLLMSSYCSAVSHSATSSTAGAPGYQKSMWTSVSAGLHLHRGAEELTCMHSLNANLTESIYSVLGL